MTSLTGTTCTPDEREKRKYEMIWRLLGHRTFGYLRHVHLRKAFSMVQHDVRSVLSIGCGMAFSEVLLALDYPEIEFNLTDITNGSDCVRGFVKLWGLKNVAFSQHNALTPMGRRYDFVMSVEVLEHIENYTLAAAEMRAASSKYVFALVPFADRAINSDPVALERVRKRHEHVRVGFDRDELEQLFPNVLKMNGSYWKEYGQKLYYKLESMSDEEIKARPAELQSEAMEDTRIDRIPEVFPEALGIWTVSRV